ncbi:MAG: hypothetical protein LLF76_01535 [Planctomycetaceae bacterium]|nr:hypothetical protein [Planctomycetaceae bacterium]
MRIGCIIIISVLSMFAAEATTAENDFQIQSTASAILREHFFVVFDMQSIYLNSRKPQDPNVGISLVDVSIMDEVTIRYRGKTLKAKDNSVFPSLVENGILAVSYAGREGNKRYASLELYSPKADLKHRYHMQQLLGILLGDNAAFKETFAGDSDSAGLGVTLQKTVRAFHDLKTNMVFPQHLLDKGGKKQGDEFDVEKYFTVLKHISMKEGYRLDYVYHPAGIGGSPILYSRKEDQLPYVNYEEYVNTIRKEADLDDIEVIEREYRARLDTEGIAAANDWRKKQLENHPGYRHWEWYLRDVCVDGTPEGWLELIVLHLLGNQFYQFWHSAYNDTMIIPDQSALSEVSEQHVTSERKVGPLMSLLGSALDISPRVEVKDQTVTVSLVTFSKWGGFYEQVFSINKDEPHKIEEMSENTLILYYCNVVF